MAEEIYENPGCLTLPEDMVDVRDFKAEEAIHLDESIELPESFSLGKWIWKTNYQGAIGSCTANSTSHGVQIMAVAKKGVEPKTDNIITPDWKDLWRNMGHNPDKYDGGDYVEKAVKVALDKGILSCETGENIKFDAYCLTDWDGKDADIERMKRYLYNLNPVIWCMRGNRYIWNQLSAGQLTDPQTPSQWDRGHAICLVGWDKYGFWFVNSWMANDDKKLKSRFHIPYDVMKKQYGILNFRAWVLYSKIDALKSPEYLKKKGNALIILKALRSIYDGESDKVKKEIVDLSLSLRDSYPELNIEYPVE